MRQWIKLLTISPNWLLWSRRFQFTNQVIISPRTPPDMMSLHQHLNQENVHEREGAVEALQSRWSSSCRAIVDRPPSHPPTRRQMGGRPSSGSVKESHLMDPHTGNSRRGLSNSKWNSGSGVITDSPPLQPLSRRDGREILESTVLLEPVVSVNADRSKDLTDKSYGGISLTDDRFVHSYRTINDGERRGGTTSCAWGPLLLSQRCPLRHRLSLSWYRYSTRLRGRVMSNVFKILQ
jgi:hypothetical protein